MLGMSAIPGLRGANQVTSSAEDWQATPGDMGND